MTSRKSIEFHRCAWHAAAEGGGTRSLYAIAPAIKALSLVVSFNGDNTDVRTIEQRDPLAALTRRIAFAAYKGEKTEANFNKLFRPLVVSAKSVEAWLGDTSCVLFIDELNKLERIRGPISDEQPDEPMTLFAGFLKENFLKSAGRYLVFTTHEVFINMKLSRYMDTTSNRNVTTRALPLIPSLYKAQESFDWPDLNAHEATFCGLVPGLILFQKNDEFPTQKRMEAVQDFLDAGFDEDVVLDLLSSLIQGDRSMVPRSLEQLMDMTDGGNMRWIPAHMVYVLSRIATCGRANISSELRRHLAKIC